MSDTFIFFSQTKKMNRASSITRLELIQEYLTRYGMPTYMTFGNIGLIFNLIIFSQPTHRKNPCSLYILTMSVCSLIGLNLALIPIIIKLDYINLILCRLHTYFVQVFNQTMRTLIVIACADRYAICNERASIRLFSQYQVAIKVIPSVFLFWIIFAILPTMLYSIENNLCDAKSGIYDLINSIYTLICFGVFPLFSMMTFGVMLVVNLAKMRARIQPIVNGTILVNQRIFRKRDRDMVRMLLIELIAYILTTVPVTVVLIYKTVAEYKLKNEQRIEIENFIFLFNTIFSFVFK